LFKITGSQIKIISTYSIEASERLISAGKLAFLYFLN
jgi:hypothetical protein